MSDRIAVMKDGRISQLGTPGELYLTPANEYVADFIGQVSFIDGIYNAHSQTVRLDGDITIPAALEHVDGPVRLVMRPENIHISDDATGVTGEVVEILRQTGTTTYQVQLANGQIVKSRSLGFSGPSLTTGGRVNIRFDQCSLAYLRKA